MAGAAAQDAADIRVAVIGVNSRGQNHLDSMPNNVVAICDVDAAVLDRSVKQFEQRVGRKVERFTDYRKLLDRNDIDAVSIATPNHTHALITVAAAQAGKDVYCEKPISHNIWEGRQMVAAAQEYNRIMQCGTQARSSRCLHEAVDFVRSGGLGKIQYAVGTCYKPRPSIGKLDKPLVIPNGIDYDLWCGPAEKRELYRPNLHYDWHWDFNTGNGDMGNQGIHQMDIARWFLGHETLAPRVISIGGRLGYEDAGNTANTQIVYHDYPAAPLIFEVRGLPRSKEAQQSGWAKGMDKYRGMQISVLVECEKGHVLAHSDYTAAYAFDRDGRLLKQWRSGYSSHCDNWLSAVVSRDPSKLNAPLHEGHLSSSLAHAGNISYRLGERQPAEAIAEAITGNDLLSSSFDRMVAHLRANDVDVDSGEGALTLGPWLELDTTAEVFTNNDKANELRTRQQREPFVIPQIESEASHTAAAG
jgi:predicted dehydrogenase